MASKVKNIFITGGNRGIGLGLTKAMLREFQPDHLFVTYRNESGSEELLELATEHVNLHPIEFEVTDYAKLPGIVKEIEKVTGGEGLNLLINNAGIQHRDYQGVRDVTRDNIHEHTEINTIAPIMITQAFLPLLEKASESNATVPEGIRRAAIVNISTILASIAEAETFFPGRFISYRLAKSALNMATKCISLELKDTGITAVLIHPGWVKTDMGTEKAPLTIDDSVNHIINTLKGVTAQDNGKFLKFDGTELPW